MAITPAQPFNELRKPCKSWQTVYLDYLGCHLQGRGKLYRLFDCKQDKHDKSSVFVNYRIIFGPEKNYFILEHSNEYGYWKEIGNSKESPYYNDNPDLVKNEDWVKQLDYVKQLQAEHQKITPEIEED